MPAEYSTLGVFIENESPYSADTALPDALGRGIEDIEFDGVAARFGGRVEDENGPAGTLNQLVLTEEQRPLALSWTFKGNTLQVTKAIKIRYTWTIPDAVVLTPQQVLDYPDRKVTTDLLIGYVGPNH
jgi:hypothetical protein